MKSFASAIMTNSHRVALLNNHVQVCVPFSHCRMSKCWFKTCRLDFDVGRNTEIVVTHSCLVRRLLTVMLEAVMSWIPLVLVIKCFPLCWLHLVHLLLAGFTRDPAVPGGLKYLKDNIFLSIISVSWWFQIFSDSQHRFFLSSWAWNSLNTCQMTLFFSF